eukprot:325169-Chlamydomonas_euryale.AAC.1
MEAGREWSVGPLPYLASHTLAGTTQSIRSLTPPHRCPEPTHVRAPGHVTSPARAPSTAPCCRCEHGPTSAT